jgi:two-component system, OmpR family, response regulator MprA
MDMGARALIVEDDRDIRDVLSSALSDEGFSVTQAVDGVEALRILEASDEPLVVLLDLVMPRMSGIEVLQAVASAAQVSAPDHRLAMHAYVLVTANRELVPAPLVQLVTPLEIAIVDKPFQLEDLLDIVQAASRRLHPDDGPLSDQSLAAD